MLADEHKQAIVPGGNGMFRSAIVRGGRVIGTWKRSAGRSKLVVQVWPLVPVSAADRTRIEHAFEPYARFLANPLQIRWS